MYSYYTTACNFASGVVVIPLTIKRFGVSELHFRKLRHTTNVFSLLICHLISQALTFFHYFCSIQQNKYTTQIDKRFQCLFNLVTISCTAA